MQATGVSFSAFLLLTVGTRATHVHPRRPYGRDLVLRLVRRGAPRRVTFRHLLLLAEGGVAASPLTSPPSRFLSLSPTLSFSLASF